MYRSKYNLSVAFILTVACVLPGYPLWAANSKWEKLANLKSGQLIRVELNDTKTYEGKFQSFTDEGITLHPAAGEQTVARKDF
jgi:hypothetical protein